MADNATVVGEDVGNTGGDKYETTAREIQICRFSTFCSKWRMTFRKVTPAALKVNVKKFWQVLLVPWHVWAPIWVHFAPWWSIFPVKNRFSHIFPAPEGSPYQSLFLRYEIEKGLRAVYWNVTIHAHYLNQKVKLCESHKCLQTKLRVECTNEMFINVHSTPSYQPFEYSHKDAKLSKGLPSSNKDIYQMLLVHDSKRCNCNSFVWQSKSDYFFAFTKDSEHIQNWTVRSVMPFFNSL